MAEEGIEVPSPHEHALEHAVHGGDLLASRVAVITAVLATIGAIVGYQGGATQNAAMLFKNEAVLKKTEASNQWAFYQAKSSKQNLAELALALAPSEKQDFYRQEVERYKKEKEEIKRVAEKFESASVSANESSEAAMHPHHLLAQALTLLQVAISLAAITVLTKKKSLLVGSLGAAAAGSALWIATFFTH